MSNTLKIGDKVTWRGGWGRDAPQVVRVVSMEVTDKPHEKYGDSVDEVDWSLVEDNRVCFILDNGSWAYSDQITPAPE